MKIPFVDLKAQYHSINVEIQQALNRILEDTAFILGEEVENFENEFAAYCQTKYCVACNSGTSALHLAFLAHGIGAGDEVVTVPHTFIAACEAISYVDAKPVFADVKPDTATIDAEAIESVITEQTKAIVPVHLYGQPADMDAIMEVAEKHDLIVIEDACQAHGAEYKDKRVGGIGHSGCFSFYPGKNLGAYGEGGAIVTDDEDIYHKIKIRRDHGQSQKYYHDVIGYNYRMDGFQGAVLRVKLRYLDQWNNARRHHAELYNELLKEADVVTPFEPDYAKGVYHLYVVRSSERDRLQRFLNDQGIATGLHYPVPIHLQKAYESLNHKRGDFPATEEWAEQGMSLPMFAELKEQQIITISEKIINFNGFSSKAKK